MDAALQHRSGSNNLGGLEGNEKRSVVQAGFD